MRTFFSLISVCVSITGISWADYIPNGSMHLVCQPDIGFFQLNIIQTFYEGRDELRKKNIFFAGEFNKSPYKCNLPGHEITVSTFLGNDGKGACGAREGNTATVKVNGVPVAHKFVPSQNYSSSLEYGNIELSDCFEYHHSVSIRATEEYSIVKLCRVGWDDYPANNVKMSGECKVWDSISGNALVNPSVP